MHLNGITDSTITVIVALPLQITAMRPDAVCYMAFAERAQSADKRFTNMGDVEQAFTGAGFSVVEFYKGSIMNEGEVKPAVVLEIRRPPATAQ